MSAGAWAIGLPTKQSKQLEVPVGTWSTVPATAQVTVLARRRATMPAMMQATGLTGARATV